MKKLSILVVQDRLRSGGTERQSVLLTRAFADRGLEAGLVTFRPGGALAHSAADLDWRSLQPLDCGWDWFAPGLCRHVRRRRPDIVLAMGRMANCHAGRVQRAAPQTAVVATLRTGKNLPTPFRRSLGIVRHVVANSDDACAALVGGHGVDPERISVIRNPLVRRPPRPGERDERLRARFGAGPGTVVLLCVAMFRPEKNQRDLVEMASGLPRELDWRLWLAGDGPAKAGCEALAKGLGLADRVVFTGYLDDPTPLYGAADVAVHASTSESLSNFLIEAQAAGLPAVAAEARGIRECFVPERTGWAIPAGDRAAFRAAVERLIREPAVLRAERGAKARAFAQAEFDPERQIGAYVQLFERLAWNPSR